MEIELWHFCWALVEARVTRLRETIRVALLPFRVEILMA
jgi:hypothetical protein